MAMAVVEAGKTIGALISISYMSTELLTVYAANVTLKRKQENEGQLINVANSRIV
jgi:hypothetical protein